MPHSYRVRLDKEYLVFSAAHFITFNGNVCERLHGHNYRVSVEVAGPLDGNHYVIDFIALRDELRGLLDELEHRVLLPAHHEAIHVVADDREVTCTFEDRRWIFPLGDCVILPVANTTAELVARYLALRLAAALEQRTGARPAELTLGVDENNGQWAFWSMHAED